MATTWNSTSIPDPEGWEDQDIFIGSQRIMADGSSVTDYMGSERGLSVTWTNITYAQRTTLQSQTISLTASADLVLPDTYTYTCVPVPDSYVETPVGGISGLWDVKLEFVVSAVT